jgi:hypothetical protein
VSPATTRPSPRALLHAFWGVIGDAISRGQTPLHFEMSAAAREALYAVVLHELGPRGEGRTPHGNHPEGVEPLEMVGGVPVVVVEGVGPRLVLTDGSSVPVQVVEE